MSGHVVAVMIIDVLVAGASCFVLVNMHRRRPQVQALWCAYLRGRRFGAQLRRQRPDVRVRLIPPTAVLAAWTALLLATYLVCVWSFLFSVCEVVRILAGHEPW